MIHGKTYTFFISLKESSFNFYTLSTPNLMFYIPKKVENKNKK